DQPARSNEGERDAAREYGRRQMRRALLLAAAAIGCLAASGELVRAQEPQAQPLPPVPPVPPPPRRAPREERFNLNFPATPLEEVFDMLSRKDGTNIILSKGVTGTVSVNLYNVTVREAIYRVAQAAGFVVDERNGDYIILAVDSPGASTQIKTFKVQYSDVKQ